MKIAHFVVKEKALNTCYMIVEEYMVQNITYTIHEYNEINCMWDAIFHQVRKARCV